MKSATVYVAKRNWLKLNNAWIFSSHSDVSEVPEDLLSIGLKCTLREQCTGQYILTNKSVPFKPKGAGSDGTDNGISLKWEMSKHSERLSGYLKIVLPWLP